MMKLKVILFIFILNLELVLDIFKIRIKLLKCYVNLKTTDFNYDLYLYRKVKRRALHPLQTKWLMSDTKTA
ncbi:hypothetical protein CWO04_03860 [Vibrio splendidus]|nr:hypothetical protein A150_01145 [Vibrio splendidus 1S-124]PMG56013.1 hypothetical protein BCU88_18285 [Vibrio splendidus]PMH66941.1 hypothetical protein BCU61_04190 [Vibrio splendidus]PMJ27336.1 hypothetical protein BCU26_19995 [Vibrio splendidus]PMK36909.1 hypothetical protein BCU01_03760 [Vibrio splendidus]